MISFFVAAMIALIILMSVIFVVNAFAVTTNMSSWANRTFREQSQRDGQGEFGKANRFANPTDEIRGGDTVESGASTAGGDVVVNLPAAFSTYTVRKIYSLVSNDTTRSVSLSVVSMGVGTFTVRARDAADAVLGTDTILFSWDAGFTAP